jgi:hypothetical protein
LEVFTSPAEQVAMWRAYVELTRETERRMLLRQKVGRGTPGEIPRARNERLDAELNLLRAKRAAYATAER